MRTIQIDGKLTLAEREAPTPEPGTGEVRIRVDYVGICGSDLHYYFEGANGAFVVEEPLAPGHELSGRAVRWHSETPKVASISEIGTATAGEPGTARVVAECEGRKAAAEFRKRIKAARGQPLTPAASATRAAVNTLRAATSTVSVPLHDTRPDVHAAYADIRRQAGGLGM